MLKFLLYWLYVTLLSFAFHSVAQAQAVVEYGIIGSRPPRKASVPGRSISRKVEAGLKQTPSPHQGYTRERQLQTKTAGKGGGPLIIERHGGRYERVN